MAPMIKTGRGSPAGLRPSPGSSARASGIPFSEGLIKNRYVGRTFIQPDQALREHLATFDVVRRRFRLGLGLGRWRLGVSIRE